MLQVITVVLLIELNEVGQVLEQHRRVISQLLATLDLLYDECIDGVLHQILEFLVVLHDVHQPLKDTVAEIIILLDKDEHT